MANPAHLDLFDKLLRTIATSLNDQQAERALLFAIGLLQMASDEFEDREAVGDRAEKVVTQARLLGGIGAI
jgi:hypothetical protein